MINEKRDAIWMAQISKCHANSISNNIHDQRDFGNTEFTTYGLHPLDPQRLVDGNLATPFFFFQNNSFENLKSKLLQVFTFQFSFNSFCFAFVCKHFSPIGLVPTTAPSTYFTKIQYEPFLRNLEKRNKCNVRPRQF